MGTRTLNTKNSEKAHCTQQIETKSEKMNSETEMGTRTINK